MMSALLKTGLQLDGRPAGLTISRGDRGVQRVADTNSVWAVLLVYTGEYNEAAENNVDLVHQFSGSPVSFSHNITTRNVQLSLALKASSYNC